MDRTTSGWMNGFIGMLIFSGSLPATRAAVGDFGPIFLTSARAAIAGGLALLLIVALKARRPSLGDLPSLVVIALGVVVGFPLMTGLALQHITSAHSLVFIGLLPLSTAIFGVLRGNERPGSLFWVFSCIGSAIVVIFALTQDMSASPVGDLLMLGAVIVCGLGYAEGGRLSRSLGGLPVISWALVLSLPVMLVCAIVTTPPSFAAVPVSAWLGLGYVSIFSMLVGFVFWYKGLSQGGIAAVGQLQLLQPFFGLALAATLLREPVNAGMLVATVGIVLCVASAKKFSAPRMPVAAARATEAVSTGG